MASFDSFTSLISADLLKAFVQHVDLCLTALAIAIIPSLFIGIAIARRTVLAEFVVASFSLLYTVPSLAFLALMVILFGLGVPSAIAALVFYAQFILIRHIVLGLQSIDPHVLEAARGIGLSRWKTLLWVETPLALPIWISGLRLATLSTVAIATTAAWINAGGLGTFIFEGISQNNPQKIMLGAGLIVLLSLWLEKILHGFEEQALLKAQGHSA
jgi:osmoprotectant transport system permease protein